MLNVGSDDVETLNLFKLIESWKASLTKLFECVAVDVPNEWAPSFYVDVTFRLVCPTSLKIFLLKLFD